MIFKEFWMWSSAVMLILVSATLRTALSSSPLSAVAFLFFPLSVPTHHICLMLLTPSQCQLTATDHVGKSSPSANSLSVCMGLLICTLTELLV